MLAIAAAAVLPPAPATAQTAAAGQTVATVNGEAVTREDVVRMFQDLGPRAQQQGFDVLFPYIREEVIGRRLLSEEARANDVQDVPEVQQRLRDMEAEVLFNYYVVQKAEERVTDAEIQAAYDEWAAQQPEGEELKLSHILVQTEEEAREVIQLVTDGEPFADLARERSLDTGSGSEGGDLGWRRRGELVAPFEEAAFALEPNTFTSTPVQTQFGWHVILLEDRRDAQAPPLEQVREPLMQQLVREEIPEVIRDAIAEANVQRFDLDGNPVDAPPAE
jgi:peptidyl-prolyl cis-trans isomerase C